MTGAQKQPPKKTPPGLSNEKAHSTSSVELLHGTITFKAKGPQTVGGTEVQGTFTGMVRLAHTTSRTSHIELTSGTWQGTASPATDPSPAAAAAAAGSTDDEMPDLLSPTPSDTSFFTFVHRAYHVQAMNRPKEPPVEVLRQRLAGMGPQPQPDFTSSTSSGTDTWAGNSDDPRSGAVTPPTPNFLEAAITQGANEASLAKASGTEGKSPSPAQEQALLALQERPDTRDPLQDPPPEVPCTFSAYEVSWGGIHGGSGGGGSS